MHTPLNQDRNKIRKRAISILEIPNGHQILIPRKVLKLYVCISGNYPVGPLNWHMDTVIKGYIQLNK